MYFKRGPFWLCIISAIILGGFFELAESVEMDINFFLFIAIIGFPLISVIIYSVCHYYYELNKLKREEEYRIRNDLYDYMKNTDYFNDAEVDDNSDDLEDNSEYDEDLEEDDYDE